MSRSRSRGRRPPHRDHTCARNHSGRRRSRSRSFDDRRDGPRSWGHKGKSNDGEDFRYTDYQIRSRSRGRGKLKTDHQELPLVDDGFLMPSNSKDDEILRSVESRAFEKAFGMRPSSEHSTLLLDSSQAGQDNYGPIGGWLCTECKRENPRDRLSCWNCRTKWQSNRSGNWECSKCQFKNFSSSIECFKCKKIRPMNRR